MATTRPSAVSTSASAIPAETAPRPPEPVAAMPWNAVMNFHYFYEFAAEDRFQGQSLGLNFAVKL